MYGKNGDVLRTTVTVREPEFTPEDVAVMLESRRLDSRPRGRHGLLLSEATDPSLSPDAADARGRFVASPVVDFAQTAIDRAKEARRKSLKNPDDDFSLIWSVSPELYDED